MHFGFQCNGRKNPEGRAERIHGRMTLLNVSDDPTEELYADINKMLSEFAKRYAATIGKAVEIRQPYGGPAAGRVLSSTALRPM